MMQQLLRGVLVLLLGVQLAACGFQLRGHLGAQALPFKTVYVQGDAASPLVIELKRAIQTGGAQLADKAEGAEATVQVLGETREKIVMSLSGAGKVREYQLRQRVSFRIVRDKETEPAEPGEILLSRNFAYDDAQVLAKEAEENMLYRDMQSDAAQQILRRLSATGVVKN